VTCTAQRKPGDASTSIEASLPKRNWRVRKLLKRTASPEASQADLETFRNRLDALRAKNLGQATFEERREVIVELGIRVCPSEDLKSLRIACGINVSSEETPQAGDDSGCRGILVGSPSWIIGKNRT
jgi:hypothetical protein